MRRSFILLCMLLISACNNRATSDVTMVLIIQNEYYILDGEKEPTASVVAAKIIAINPKILKIYACSSAKTSRILDVKSQLDGKFTGDIHLDSNDKSCL